MRTSKIYRFNNFWTLKYTNSRVASGGTHMEILSVLKHEWKQRLQGQNLSRLWLWPLWPDTLRQQHPYCFGAVRVLRRPMLWENGRMCAGAERYLTEAQAANMIITAISFCPSPEQRLLQNMSLIFQSHHGVQLTSFGEKSALRKILWIQVGSIKGLKSATTGFDVNP